MNNSKVEIIISAKDAGLSSTVGKAINGFKSLKDHIRSSVEEAKSLDSGLVEVGGKFAAVFGGLSATAFAKSIYDAGTKMDQLEKSFATITGSAQAAMQELDFVRNTAEELGMEFTTTADAYKMLTAASKGTALEGKATRDIFSAISEASTSLGMSVDETQGSLLAISQMISKGNVSAEELRGQLGERLPGAFQIAARAMGVTTQELDKLLQQGQVTAVDMLPKLATELHKAFGKGAVDGADGPVAALNRFRNAWFELRVDIGKAGLMDVATAKIKDLTAAMNDPQIRQKITDLSARFFDLAEATISFAVNHGEVIAKIGGGLVVLSALSRTCALLTGIWKGLNAVMVATAGMQLIPYLSQLRTGLDLAKISAMGLSGVLGTVAGSGLAFLAGMNIGERIYQVTEKAEGELRQLQHEIDITAAKLRQFAGFNPASHENLFAKSEHELESYREQLEKAYQYQSAIVRSLFISSRKANMWGMQTEGAMQAEVELAAAKVKLKELEDAMDAYRAAADNAHVQAAAAAGKSASTQKQVTGDALKEMKKQYQEYAKEIRQLQEDLTSRGKSLAAELRDMARTGMPDSSAWSDQKKEAEEYMVAAKRAAQEAAASMKSGDTITAAMKWKEAVQYADDAKQSYKELNKEVQVGETVVVSKQQALKTAMDGVTQAGSLAASIIKQQQVAAVEAMNALTEKSGFANLAEGMADAEQKWMTAWEGMKNAAGEKITLVKQQIEDLGASAEQVKEKMNGAFSDVFDPPEDGDWGKVWSAMESGSKQSSETVTGDWDRVWDNWLASGSDDIKKLNKMLDELVQDRTMKIYVEKVEMNRWGGLVADYGTSGVSRFARGGKLPGYGGGDRVKALLEAGEFVVRKEAVSHYGVGYLQALNSMRVNDISTVRARIGGLISGANSAAYQRFQQGGLAAAKAPAETVNLNLTLPGSSQPIPMKITPDHVRQLERIIKNMDFRRSRN